MCLKCLFDLQLSVGRAPWSMAASSGAGLPSSSAAALFLPQGSPDWPLLQEAPCRMPGQQRDHGAGHNGLHVPHADGI